MSTNQEQYSLNHFMDSYLKKEDKTPPAEDIDYSKSFKINSNTENGWNEHLDAVGQPKIVNGEVVGGVIYGTLSRSGNGGAEMREMKPEEVSLERWKAFVHKSIKLEQKQQIEEINKRKASLEAKKKKNYQEQYPLNHFMDSYLKKEDMTPPAKDIDYSKSFKINSNTGKDWNAHLDVVGQPKIVNGEVVGGVIYGTLSRSGNGGAEMREMKPEEVSLERWKAFVHKSIKLEQEKKNKNMSYQKPKEYSR